jgi:hypothetical protein
MVMRDYLQAVVACARRYWGGVCWRIPLQAPQTGFTNILPSDMFLSGDTPS